MNNERSFQSATSLVSRSPHPISPTRSRPRQVHRETIQELFHKTVEARNRIAAIGSAASSMFVPQTIPITRSQSSGTNGSMSLFFNSRSLQDAQRLLVTLTPSTSRMRIGGANPLSDTAKKILYPTTKSLSIPDKKGDFLNSPAQLSPLRAYGNSTASYEKGGTRDFNPFKTKNQINRIVLRTESESLDDLLQKLKKEQPERYNWQKIDESRAERDAQITKLKNLNLKDKIRAPPLPQSILKHVEKALYTENDPDTALVENFNLCIKPRDFKTLRDREWLNDEVINFYMCLIGERSKGDGQPKVHGFNTFFYSNLSSKGYPSVRRWAKKAKVDISSMDYILVPVHLGVHWCMAIINKKKERFEYWDSLSGGPGRVFQHLREYYSGEIGGRVDLTNWTDYIPDVNSILHFSPYH